VRGIDVLPRVIGLVTVIGGWKALAILIDTAQNMQKKADMLQSATISFLRAAIFNEAPVVLQQFNLSCKYVACYLHNGAQVESKVRYLLDDDGDIH
jgi:hypothetical protein